MKATRIGSGFAAMALVLCGMGAPVLAQQPDSANAPVDPSNRAEDSRVTDQIRKALAADSSLSASARSVDIATNAQAVVLRGAVATPEDKSRIETIAGQYAGSRQVESELTIQDNATPAAHHIAQPTPRS